MNGSRRTRRRAPSAQWRELKKASPEGRDDEGAQHLGARALLRKMKGVARPARATSRWACHVARVARGRPRRARQAARAGVDEPGRGKKRAAMNKPACLDVPAADARRLGALQPQGQESAQQLAFVVEQMYRIGPARGARQRQAARAQHVAQAPPHPAKKSLARWKNKPLSKAFNQWVEIFEAMMGARCSSRTSSLGPLQGAARLEYLELRDDGARRLWAAQRRPQAGFNGWASTRSSASDARRDGARHQGHARRPHQEGVQQVGRAHLRPAQPDVPRARPPRLPRALARAARVGRRQGPLGDDEGRDEAPFNRQLWGRELAGADGGGGGAAAAHVAAAGFQGGLRKAFNQWSHVLELLAPLRAGLNRLIHRQTSKAFESWQAVEERLLMKKALSSVLHAPSSAAGTLALLEARRPARARQEGDHAPTPQGKAFNTWPSRCSRSPRSSAPQALVVDAARQGDGPWAG